MAEVALDPGLSSSAAYCRFPRSRGSALLLFVSSTVTVASCVVTSGDSSPVNAGELMLSVRLGSDHSFWALCLSVCSKRENVAF